jgi:hypothetical protein
VKLPTGAVMNVYRFDGTKIKDITDFEDGGKYICGGAEPFSKISNASILSLSLLFFPSFFFLIDFV